MSPAAVRRARAADLAAAAALWRRLQAEHEARDARFRLDEDAALRWHGDFRTALRSELHRVWVAEAPSGGLVGLLSAQLAEPAPVYAPSLFVFVSDLIVAEAWRGRGLGSALLDRARAWGVAEGAADLRAGVLADGDGRGFWARQGARDYSVVVTMPLS